MAQFYKHTIHGNVVIRFDNAEQLKGECRQLEQFLQKYALITDTGQKPADEGDRPFLSVVTRTQARRPQTLRDTMLSLAGQSDQDFELVVVVHSQAAGDLESTREIAEEFPSALRDRIRLVACTRSGRSAPLNDGFALARGHYICALDDDDFVFAHWVETFRRLSEEAEGTILRATCVHQPFELSSTGGRPRALSWFEMTWPDEYDAVAHLSINSTPLMSVAFPAYLFCERGLRFDETLSTTEDWDLLLRATMLCGVHSSPNVTAVYRGWTSGDSSRFVHAQKEFATNEDRIIASMNSGPILLPAGATAKIVKLIDDRVELIYDRNALSGKVRQLEGELASIGAAHAKAQIEVAALQSRVEWLGIHIVNERLPVTWEEENARLIAHAQHQLMELISSRSWRVSRLLRRVSASLRRQTYEEIRVPPNFKACQEQIIAITRSRSWRLTSPLRRLTSFLRGGHQAN